MNPEEKKVIVDRINQLSGITINQSILLQAIVNILMRIGVTELEIKEEFTKVQTAYIKEQEKKTLIVPEKKLTVVEPNFSVVGNGNDGAKAN